MYEQCMKLNRLHFRFFLDNDRQIDVETTNAPFCVGMYLSIGVREIESVN